MNIPKNGSAPLYTLTETATAAITANRFVNFAGGAPSAAAAALGVSQYDAAIGEIFAVDIYGIAVVEAGAAITKGSPVATNGVGKALTAISTNIILGYALDAATADTDLIRVKLV